MAWSDEQIKRLEKLWQDGYSAGEIAASFGGKFTRSAIIGKIHRMGFAERSKQQKRRGPAFGAFGLPTRKKKQKPKPKVARPPSFGPPNLKGEPVPPPRPDDIPTKTFSELEWNDGCCRWRCDVPFRNQPYGFCGKETVPGLSVCQAHAARQFANWPDVKHRYEVKEPEREKETA